MDSDEATQAALAEIYEYGRQAGFDQGTANGTQLTELKVVKALRDAGIEVYLRDPDHNYSHDRLLKEYFRNGDLSERAYRCLRKADIDTIGELVRKTEDNLLDINNFGQKCLDEIKVLLTEIGLELKRKDD